MAASELLRLVPDAPSALRDILDPARGPVEPPIRSELFGLQRFAQHGRSLAETHRAERAHWGAPGFFPRLRDNIGVLREAHRYIGLQARTGYDISPAAEWLLDNFHLIEAQLRQIREGLPRRYFRALPVLLDEPLAGLPRVYGVAWAFVAHTDGAFDEALAVRFLAAYEEVRPLDLREMWALPTTLRVVMIENLRRLAERVATHKAAREVANLCSDRLERLSLHAVDALLALMRRRGVGQAFLAQMGQRMQDRMTSGDAAPPDRYREWVQRELPDLAAVQTQQRADQAADNLSVSNAVTSLRAIGDADWPDIVARSSTLMRLMLGSRVFEAEATASRDLTLHGIEDLARRSGRSEVAVARLLLACMDAAGDGDGDAAAAVAGHWLDGPGRPALTAALGLHEGAAQAWRVLVRQGALPAYLGSVALVTGGLVAALWQAGGAPGPLAGLALALMLWPASEAAVAVINRLISESVRPRPLPRLALAAGIPPDCRVMVAIPALLGTPASIGVLVHRLELHYLANPEPCAQFALLSDWVDAAEARAPDDDARLADACRRVCDLNARHPRREADTEGAPRFIVLHRERRFSDSEQRWIGWERKRGKLESLIATLDGAAAAPFMDLGDHSRIAAGTRYILTLDSDTQLPPGRLRELVGVAAHPLNAPRLDASGRRVVGGYAILQPRIVTPLPAPRAVTPYHWLFAGQCGIDPYSAATSEVYQDVFAEGTFTGKGLLDVRALQATLGGRLPDGQVLSHDLLEGSIARCAAVSDITLIEDAPVHADVAASRVHRWTRGDWQLLPFLWPFGKGASRLPIRAINRWKMFDNLRRSLVAPASLALLLLALSTEVMSPGAALLLVTAAFTAGPLMGAVAGFSPSRDDIALRHFYRRAGVDLVRAACGGLWFLAQLLQQSMAALDAIGRALYRLGWSRRHLLQWTTAESAQAEAGTSLRAIWRRHRVEPLVAALLLAAMFASGSPAAPRAALLLCLLWAASPLWTWWVSRASPSRSAQALAPQDREYLAGIARDTWRFFERCVGAPDHHLPPDNLQVTPHDIVAHRTSPTNIGLYLLSAACARRFGWIGTQDLLARLEATLGTLAALPRHKGHFLNWYDTQTLAPLLPMYVSTVDSGNLCGHLLAVAQACRELASAPLDAAPCRAAIQASRARLAPLLAARATLLPAQRDALRWRLADLRATRRSAARDLAGAGSEADATRRLLAAGTALEGLAREADFGFLYHRRRHLFHIGYRVAEQQLDAGFYDLLASEARLTSLLAVANGNVPVRHWASLGRPFFAVGADAGLRSWSGSMFEYLMPTLVLDEPHGSVLRGAGCAALVEQIAFARRCGVPWGISESAYAGSDHTLAYQYAPQGVPRLALRRTPPDELVVAPYATALAAQIAPHRACANFAALEALSARARYGFIEALDFTPARQSGGDAFTPVGTFMAHHQGMTIVALANVLLDGVAQRWGMADAQVEAVSSLLHERAPREVSGLDAPVAEAQAPRERRLPRRLLREVLPGATALEPTHLLSSGRLGVSLRANGAGASHWGRTGLTRVRDDALRDDRGSFFYLRWDRQPRPVSITQHPAPDPAAHYRCTFHADRVCFDAAWPALQAHVTVWVSPEDDIEFRQVELRNLGDRALDIELISALEPTLADPRADEAHPAFGNLFVGAQWHPGHRALLLERTPRLPTEQRVQAAHFIADSDPQVVGLRCQTDRQRWLGRNRSSNRPLASFDALPLAPADGAPDAPRPLDTGLDPVAALAVQLRIGPSGKARLTFATAASDREDKLLAVIDKYRQPTHVQRASLMSATLAGIRLRALRISPEDFAAVQTLTTALLLTLTRPHAQGAAAAEPGGRCDRRLLWRFGISGDRPLILVSAGAMQGLGLLRSLAQALRLWSWGGVACDVVIVNAEPASYLMALQHELGALRDRLAADIGPTAGTAPTALHLLRAGELSADELATLRALARVQLSADGRPLRHHVQEWAELHEAAFERRHEGSTTALVVAAGPLSTAAAPVGAFAAGSGEFRFEVGAALRPTRPWINVLANPGFGTQVSEAGGGYTWALNSRLHQLTGWSNDPVADPPSEWFLLQDRRTLQAWSVSPSAWGDERLRYQVCHGQGFSVIRHRRGDLEVTVTWCVDEHAPVKQVHVRLLNRGHRTQRLRLVGIAEWVMGAGRADRATVHTAPLRQRLPAAPSGGADRRPPLAQKLIALLCTQREQSAGFGDATAFFATTGPADEREDWTCDRRECFDARGRLVLPDHFGQLSGGGLDPCAALSTQLDVAAGEVVERVFLLGHAASPEAARALAVQASTVSPAIRLQRVQAGWDALLGATTVKTPDPLFDTMVNRWLLYQTASCRLWAKAGFYQAGGATGFRDQLQDAMALVWAAPAMLRQQVLLCASRQFVEGDVQHWWHAPTGAGVRTHFSDDLLWLPHACVHYLRATGDTSLLEESVPFLEGAAIAEGAEDRYDTPIVGPQQATVYEHAARAIDRSLRVGIHGLPLMGSGDWNDGMNRVGIEGRGESVWLGWFLCQLVADFAPLALARGEAARALRWDAAAQGWRAALDGPAWDGAWYRRAFFDNGEPLGAAANAEARIDLIAQAWAVLSGVAPAGRQRQALAAVEAHLVDHAAGLVRLLTPPLAHAVPSAGYIQAYPPGVRENGGQYAHAAVWALMAQAQAGQAAGPAAAAAAGDIAYRYFCGLSPAHRAAHPDRSAAYGIEPYVMAGDVYTVAPRVGRGGWSWYTGAAAWMHRAAVESVFGLRIEGGHLSLRPCLPSHWPQAEITLERDGRTMHFVLRRPDAAGAEPGARQLLPGESLAWRDLPVHSRFVVPLTDGEQPA